ncbi:SURF1 family protein [Roseovarius albus]|uniref:SURF1-like protein n=1 Tax=Roseovarius albus TaxID=1247867 RepID=A0A1X6YG18_9RHOB|nr:SURF1 family protein [Roseovarius albus]SLN20383.1 SURF1 family protein [Roseovarius albus]
MHRILIPLLFGLIGAAVLISLGTWQMQRLAWKEEILTGIESRITAEPVALPESPNPDSDKYLPVIASGTLGMPEVHVLVSSKKRGAVYRVIQPFETEGRRILVDMGTIPLDEKHTARAQPEVTLTGNLHWPQEIDSYTPEADVADNIWFARDVLKMAETLQTEPILLVVRKTSQTVANLTPLPVDTVGIPNDHLEYAITWFSLSAIWLVMTGYFFWRMRHKPEGTET